MGKRKSATIKRPKARDKLATTFDCPFCNHPKCVETKMERKRALGMLFCRVCNANYAMRICNLTEPIDIYSQWIDRCEEENSSQGRNQPSSTGPALPAGPLGDADHASLESVQHARDTVEVDAEDALLHEESANTQIAAEEPHESCATHHEGWIEKENVALPGVDAAVIAEAAAIAAVQHGTGVDMGVSDSATDSPTYYHNDIENTEAARRHLRRRLEVNEEADDGKPIRFEEEPIHAQHAIREAHGTSSHAFRDDSGASVTDLNGCNEEEKYGQSSIDDQPLFSETPSDGA